MSSRPSPSTSPAPETKPASSNFCSPSNSASAKERSIVPVAGPNTRYAEARSVAWLLAHELGIGEGEIERATPQLAVAAVAVVAVAADVNVARCIVASCVRIVAVAVTVGVSVPSHALVDQTVTV